ncbi:MAG: class I SAM-dependent methyltransferase [Gammaproteobacteria bacterium]
MASAISRDRGEAEMLAANRDFYNALWGDARLVEPWRFNTWVLAGELTGDARACLEVAPGMRPRFPLAGTQFLDLSAVAVTRLRARGADAAVGSITALPFASGSFDCVCAFDIVEHVEDDEAAFAELARVSEAGATLLLSVPLFASAWTAFDAFVGHCRRYEPEDLIAKLNRHGFAAERSAAYGMQPQSAWLLELGMWFLVHRRAQAMRWYNRVIMPIGLHRQKPLQFRDGLIDDPKVDTALLVCRKSGG